MENRNPGTREYDKDYTEAFSTKDITENRSERMTKQESMRESQRGELNVQPPDALRNLAMAHKGTHADGENSNAKSTYESVTESRGPKLLGTQGGPKQGNQHK